MIPSTTAHGTTAHGTIVVRRTSWQLDAAILGQIRTTVFIVEQQVPQELEWEEADLTASHFIASIDDMPIGTSRLLSSGQIGRMAVLRAYRLRGVGKALLSACEVVAAELALDQSFLHAQTHAISFYEKSGYRCTGPEFMDAGIAHRNMIKKIRSLLIE